MKAKNKLLTLMILSAGAAVTTSIINKCIKLSAISKNLMSPSKALCFRWRFGNIHYTKTGNGRPILLIHNLEAASSGYEWNQIIESLKESHTVYAIDLLGCGRSEKPILTYTNYMYVQLISDFIKSEIGHRTDVIASGGSAAFTIMACNNSPELFDKIMVINPDSLLSCSHIPGKHAKLYKFILDFPIIGTLLYNIAVSKKSLTENFTHEHYYNPYSVKSSLIDIYYESAHLGESPKSLFASVYCNYTKCNIVNALRKIDNSIYLVGGSQREHILDIMKEYKAYNSAIEYSSISKTKGLPQLENPSELLNIINMFFT